MVVALFITSGAHVFGANLPPPSDLVCSLTQIPNAHGGGSDVDPIPFFPSINAAGTRIAFESAFIADSSNLEIFLADTTTGSLTQLTRSSSGRSRFPSINAAGIRIAFESRADLTGGNADGNAELFLVDTTTGSLTQLTTGGSGGGFPSINAAGTRIAFGNAELFLVDTTTGSLTQLTTGGSGGGSPSINASGTRIAFTSSADLTGDNADGNAELFLVDTTTGGFTQLTNTTSGQSGSPSINASGTRIAFTSSADLTGDNADGNAEFFLVDTTTGGFTQLTNTTSGNIFDQPIAFHSINAAGTRIAFRFNGDPTGGNANQGDHIFLVDTTTGNFTQLTPPGFFNFIDSRPSINAAGTRIAFGLNQRLSLATCVEIVNDLVTFAPLSSTFQTTANTAGCPAGFAGKFSFQARLTAKSSSPALTDLQVQARTLTNGNLLQNADGGPGGVGATLTVSQTGALADGILSPAEFVDVPFVVCLQQRSPFSFFVDVLGGNL